VDKLAVNQILLQFSKDKKQIACSSGIRLLRWVENSIQYDTKQEDSEVIKIQGSLL